LLLLRSYLLHLLRWLPRRLNLLILGSLLLHWGLPRLELLLLRLRLKSRLGSRLHGVLRDLSVEIHVLIVLVLNRLALCFK
jgi:hypothetical protein